VRTVSSAAALLFAALAGVSSTTGTSTTTTAGTAEGPIALHISELGDFALKDAVELATTLARAIETRTARATSTDDPAWTCELAERCASEVRARTGARDIVLIRIFAGPTRIHVLAERDSAPDRDTARDAALDTARETSRTARDTARDTARETSRTARDASRDSARDASRDSARDAAHDRGTKSDLFIPLARAGWSDALAPLALALFPEAAAKRAPSAAELIPPPPGNSAEKPVSIAPWLAIGTGVVATVVGIAFGASNSAAREQVRSGPLRASEYEPLESRAETHGIAAYISFGVAGAAFATGAVLLIAE
jgi:hypothetical protein